MNVLVFVEDPGAANYLAEVPAALAKTGAHVTVVADGSARPYLTERGATFALASIDGAAEELVAATKPAVVVLGTSENLDSRGLALVPAARARGIPTIGAVDAFANAAHRFRGRTDDPLAFAPDRVLVPDVWTKDAFVALGMADDAVIVCGHPHYDHVLAERARLAELDRRALRARLFPTASIGDAPLIVFVAEISTGLDPAQFRRSADYRLAGRGERDGRTEIVLEELIDAVAAVAPQAKLVVRLHPKNTVEELGALAGEVTALSRGGSPLEVVQSADLVVGMTSMLLFEAALLGKRTLALVPRELEREWLPSLRSGVTPTFTDRVELRAWLQRWTTGELSSPTMPAIEHGALDRVCSAIRTATPSRT